MFSCKAMFSYILYSKNIMNNDIHIIFARCMHLKKSCLQYVHASYVRECVGKDVYLETHLNEGSLNYDAN